MANCLLLGANGFIGSHMVDKLVSNHEKVRAFGRFNESPQFFSHGNIEIVTGDFLNKSDLYAALKDIDYVFHFVSNSSPATADNNPFIDIETNILMSIELFEACVQHKIKKIIFASSGGSIYGEPNQETPISENVVPQPVSPYAIGKLTIEHYLRYYRKKYGLDSVVFRIANAYGERCSLVKHQGVIPIFLYQILQDKPITLLGDGSMVRDYIYVQDLTELIAKVYKTTKQPVYNLSSGVGVSLNQLLVIIKKVTQKPISIEYAAKPATFIEKIILDNALYKNEFNLRPETSLETGIKKTWEYLLAQYS